MSLQLHRRAVLGRERGHHVAVAVVDERAGRGRVDRERRAGRSGVVACASGSAAGAEQRERAGERGAADGDRHART